MKSKFLFFITLLISIFLFSQCTKEYTTQIVKTDTISVIKDSSRIVNKITNVNIKDSTYFVIYVQKESNDLYVNFATTDFSVIPTVVFNGNKMTGSDFFIENGILNGSMIIPVAKDLNFKITSRGKSDSASFMVPSDIKTISGNGNEFIYTNSYNQDTINLTSATTTFTITCDTFNYFEFNISNYDDFTSSTTKMYILPAGVYYYSIYPYTGIQVSPGVGPNVRGSYGAGYVQIQGNYKFGELYLNNISKSARVISKKTSMVDPVDHFSLLKSLLLKQ